MAKRKISGNLQFPTNFEPNKDIFKNPIFGAPTVPGMLPQQPQVNLAPTAPQNLQTPGLQTPKITGGLTQPTATEIIKPAQQVTTPITGGIGGLTGATALKDAQKTPGEQQLETAFQPPTGPTPSVTPTPGAVPTTGGIGGITGTTQLKGAPKTPAEIQQETAFQPPKPVAATEVTKAAEEVVTPIERDTAVIDDLAAKAKEFLTSTEDPNAQRIFNQAISNIGAFNQAQRDLLQQQINQNPDLVGQPAGTALLSMLARQQGFDLANLTTKLSIEAANRIRELNRFGFNQSFAIEEFRIGQKADLRGELLDAGDIDAYANQLKKDTGIEIDTTALKELSPATVGAVNQQLALMDAALAAGNLDAARGHFDTILALSPNAFAGAEFDTLGFEDKSFLLKSAQDEQIEGQIRLDIAQQDLIGAQNGINSLFDEAVRIEQGNTLLAEKSLEEINSALEFAGKAPVTDKSELLGREDEVFSAFKMQEIDGASDKTAIDAGVDIIMKDLAKTNPGIMIDPDAESLVRTWVRNIELGLDPNDQLLPWDPKSPDSYEFFSWPVLDVDGNTVPGTESEFYTESNPRPAPNTALGQEADRLDKAWVAYLRATPVNEQLTRLGWFDATKAGTQEPDPTLVKPGDEPPDTGEPDIPGTFGGDIETAEEIAALTPLEFEKLLDNRDKLIELEKGDNPVIIRTTSLLPTSLNKAEITSDSILVIRGENGEDIYIKNPEFGTKKVGFTTGVPFFRGINLLTGNPISMGAK